MSFNTELTAAQWDESSHAWLVQTSKDVTYRARYLLSALGLLSKQNFPDIAGIDSFVGEKYHTGAWPGNVDLKGKRVGVVGNGSTGVQVITEIAPHVGHLTSFQRNPQYSVPSGQRRVTQEERSQINGDYEKIWKDAKDGSLFAFGFQETGRPTFSVDEAEREKIYEEAWNTGGGFRFMFETFGDISIDEAANNSASDFIKKKIRETVKDQEKARKLMPTQLYARRPLCDSGYYEQFNRDNVDVVSLAETPIEKITPKGVLTADGKEHELDVLIFATGFDAVDGNYTRVLIKGRNGESLKDHWSSVGPTSYLGVSVPNFPNMFMVLGPNGPFSNIPPAIESQVEFISAIIASAEGHGDNVGVIGSPPLAETVKNADVPKSSSPVVEATDKAEEDWTEECDKLSASSLFRKTDSWIFGSNVPGKKHAVMFYFAGISAYRKVLREVIEGGWKGFSITAA